MPKDSSPKRDSNPRSSIGDRHANRYTTRHPYYTVNMIGMTWPVHRTKTLLHCEHDRYHVTCTQNKDSITLWTWSVSRDVSTEQRLCYTVNMIGMTWRVHSKDYYTVNIIGMTWRVHSKDSITLWTWSVSRDVYTVKTITLWTWSVSRDVYTVKTITLWTWSVWRDVYTEQRLFHTVN